MCYSPNILQYRQNSVIKKDGNLGISRDKIIFSHSPEFKGYEYYLKENERLKNSNTYGQLSQYKLIPCGKCKECRKIEKLNWATRIELEAKQYQNNYFITLTYNDENIYIPEQTFNNKTGEIFENDGTWIGSLVKKDLTQFIKSTRNWLEREYNWTGIKFYACGEYGEIGERPHYHIILMNMPELELSIYGQTKKNIYHTCKRLVEIWHKGYVTVEPVNWDTIAYTAGYCEKKLFGEVKEEYYASKGQIPIFAQMSRRPGIGRAYFEENKYKIYECDEIINSKGKPNRPPSYFDRLMDIGEHDVIQEIKKNREENNLNKIKKILTQTDLTLWEYNQVRKRTDEAKDKAYRRRYKIL